MSDVRTWVASFDEAEAVASLLVAFREHLGHERGPSDNAMLAGVERLMEAGEAEFLLGAADDDSPPVGMAQVRFRFSVWTAAPDCWLEDLFVAPQARRRGIASALLEQVVQRARERGCRRVELDTNSENAQARALYAGFGFTESKSGAGQDLFLGLRLPDA